MSSQGRADPYQTSNKMDYRTSLRVKVDFSDFDKSIRQVKSSVSELNKAAKELGKNNKFTDKGFGIYIDSRAVTPGTEILLNLPGGGGELSSYLSNYLTKVGKYGKDIMKKYTREDTGLMKSEVRYMQKRDGSKEVSVDIGWVRKWYQYFGWQEQGTRTGIKPMNAILRTRAEVLPYAQQEFSKAFTKYFLK